MWCVIKSTAASDSTLDRSGKTKNLFIVFHPIQEGKKAHYLENWGMATFGIGTSFSKVGVSSFLNLNGSEPVTKHPFCSASVSRKGKGSCASFSDKYPILITGLTGNRSCICRSTCSNSRIMASAATETEKLGIKIVRNPPESKLSELGVRSWPKWGCPPSNFPWTYSSKETCYLLKGKVKVYPNGSNEAVEIGAGDLVVFPKGMSCTWDVSEAVDKHYKFD